MVHSASRKGRAWGESEVKKEREERKEEREGRRTGSGKRRERVKRELSRTRSRDAILRRTPVQVGGAAWNHATRHEFLL
jgi:hypothetical protein